MRKYAKLDRAFDFAIMKTNSFELPIPRVGRIKISDGR